MSQQGRPHRRRRWLLIIGVAVIAILITAFTVLRVAFEGPALGDKISTTLNKRMRGRIAIGSVEWSTDSLAEVVTGGWVPVVMRDVKVWDDCALNTGAAALDDIRWGDPDDDCTLDDQPDPDPASKRRPRKLLLDAPLITAEIDIHAIMFGNHDFVFRNIWVHGGEALLEQTREPYPLHAYDRTIVSIVTAFYPRMKAGFRAGIFADPPPPVFDLRDIHIKGLNLTVHMTPDSSSGPNAGYVTSARFEDLDVDAGEQPRNDSYLYMDPVDPLVAKFYVRIAATAKRGKLRLWDGGPREAFRLPHASESYPPSGRDAQYTIDLADIKVNRLAQLPSEWARKDYVANTLELDIEARTLPCSMSGEPVVASDGALVHVTGELFNYWDRPYDGSWNFALDGKNFGPTVRSCIKRTIGGDQLEGRISLTGPFVAPPKISLALKNMDFDVALGADQPPLRLTLAEVAGSIDLVNEQGSIDKTTALIRGGKDPGEVEVAATFGLKPYNARAHLEIVKAIDVSRFLPASAAPIGGFLQGRLSAVGDAEVGFALEDFDLALGRTATEKSIRVHRGRLFTNNGFDTMTIQRVAVEAGRSHAIVDGRIEKDPKTKQPMLDITIDGDFPDLDVWLARFHLPQFIKSAGAGIIKIKGPLTNPTINVATELGGIPCLDKVQIIDSQFNSDTRVLEIRDMRSASFGGTLRGSARLVIGDKASGRPTVIERLHVEGRTLDAAKICKLAGVAKGTIDTIDIDLAGSIDPNREPLDWLALAKVYAQAKRLTIANEKLTNLALCLNRKDDAACRPRASYLDSDDTAQCEAAKRGGFCAVASATRDGGGLLDATIARGPGRTASVSRLGGTVAMSDVPIGFLDSLLGVHSGLGGQASARLHLAGTVEQPMVSGVLHLLRTWAGGAFLGDAQLAIEPGRSASAVAIRGSALAGRVKIAGTLGTQAPYPVELAITGHRIELDPFIDLEQRFNLPVPVQAWMTGTVTVRSELKPATPKPPEAWVELTELVAVVPHRLEDGRFTPLRLAAVEQSAPNVKRPAVSLRVTPESINFQCRDAKGTISECTTRLAVGAQAGMPAGVIDFRGHATPKHIAIEANGKLDLAPIGPLVDGVFSRITGTADLSVSVAGTFEKPVFEASILPKQLEATPVGNDTIIEVPSGLIKLANNTLGFTEVNLRVRDLVGRRARQADDRSELHIGGLITLDGFTPKQWNVFVNGAVAGKLLVVLAPKIFSQASGAARIKDFLMFTGAGRVPTISGTLAFDDPICGEDVPEPCRRRGEPPNTLTIIPRGLLRELAISEGSVGIETSTINDHRVFGLAVNDVSLTVDGEGRVTDIDGEAKLRDDELTELSLRLDADAIPFKRENLDLVLSAERVEVKKRPGGNLEATGDISILDGTFRGEFEIGDTIRSLGSSAPPTIPIWDLYPLIGNARLNIDVAVQKFTILSNIATIDLAGGVELTETPRDARLSGQIRVERGRFKLPGMRAAFTHSGGEITFSKDQRPGNPELRVTSDADYRDLNGQDHVITLTVAGYLDTLGWDLKTSTGYNKSQTVSLLLLGRNPEQLRRSLGDQSLGSDPTVVDPTTNPSQGFADQIVKDLAGDWVSDLLENSLTRFTGLDVLRIEVGFGSIGFHIEKRLYENLQLLTTFEQTIRGYTINARGELKSPRGLSLQGGYLSKRFNDPAEQDIVDSNIKLVYRWFIP